ncbi:MAG TPA: 50S ribosomal protein L17 [Candidatus Sulfotelmatobacter sp.]|nr:50S ribosomal protein L17 [Candidatus Sulfotelmatobacter sp.]
MKKKVFGRKFKRDKNERTALFKSLMSSLVMNEKIKTTEEKAKAIRPQIEKLITKAKKGENSAKLVLEKNLSKEAFDKMVKDLGPRFAKRQGGYTRIIKLGERFGDDASVVLMEWTESSSVIVPAQIKKVAKPKKIKEEKPKSKAKTKPAPKKTVKKVKKTK